MNIKSIYFCELEWLLLLSLAFLWHTILTASVPPIEEENIALNDPGNDACQARSPPLEKRHLRDITDIGSSSPIFAIYPDPFIHWKSFVSDQWYELFYENLIKKSGWQVYKDDLPRVDVLLMIDMNPSESIFTMLNRLKDSGRVMHFLYWVDDLHWHRYSQFEIKNRTYSLPYLNLLGGGGGAQFNTFYPDIAKKKKTLWIPHSASRRFQQSLNVSAAPKVLLSGHPKLPWYPYRFQAKNLMDKGDPNLVQLVHPGYDANLTPSFHVDYVSRVTAFSTGFTSSLVLNYIVAKIFEIPAMGQLLLINHEIEPHLKALCLSPNIHFLSYSSESMKSVIQRATHEDFATQNWRIRQAARSVIMKMHTTDSRAQLVTKIALSLMQGKKPMGFSFKHSDAIPIRDPEVATWMKEMTTGVCRKSEQKKEKKCKWTVFHAMYRKKRKKKKSWFP